MYLKSIEVQGFKSFANKIKFQFHNGITGIVGPNGSGKSNVADAVRWVLGEQRIKQLRGASMQDVIFSGTEMRKPLSYAYVAITLDNSDHQLAIEYDEVTVSRRLYRSGESEYAINGTVCRLKDVNELFYDTGIGKEGYSIIGQGQIDKILSGKPEDRRELFDEAAGIVKFKRRKIASEKKLEDERQNLLRVRDILGELEKQIGPLEKQSEKAKIYIRKKEELKTLDVNMFLLENNSIKEQLSTVEENHKIASEQLESVAKKYENTKEEYERIAGVLEMLETTIEQERKTLADTGIIRGRLEGDINVLREQIKSIQSNEAHLLQRKENMSGQVALKEAEEAALAEKKTTVDMQLAEAMKERDLTREALNAIQNRIADLNSQIESGKNTIIKALNERATIKSRLERIDTLAEQIGIRKAELTSKLVSAKTDEEKRQDEIVRLEQEFAAISEGIAALNAQQKEKEALVAELKEKMQSLDDTLRDTQVSYHEDKAKLESLSNLTERYEGYGGSVKKVMEQKEKNKGIIGVVADIIQVEKKYEVAIETALGGNIQNIVTDNEETAKKMIAFLKAEKGGRATFLPLTSIKNPQEFKTPEVLKEKGVLGLANTLVHTKKEYNDVSLSMLGRIVVVDNVDNAVTIARKYGYGVRMVTLEGELLVPGGAISGGAFKNNSNLLGRRREMEELQKKIEDAVKKIDSLQEEIQTTKERRNSFRTEVETIKLTLQTEFIKQNTARLAVTGARERQEEFHADYDALKQETEELKMQEASIGAEREQITIELEQSLTCEKQAEEAIAKFEAELKDKRAEESMQAEEVSKIEVSVEKILQQTDFEQQNINRVLAEKERLMGELSEILQEIGNSTESVQYKENEISQIQQTILASHTTETDTEKLLAEDLAKKEELSAKQKNFFTEREELSEQMNHLDKEVYRLNAQIERLKESIQNQIDYMWNEYEITLHDAAKLRDEEMNDLAAMKKDVAALRDSIKKLGDVNVNAIEEFKEVSERYTFLKTQHDDLVEAEKTLLQIIEELDTAMRRQFREKFQKINHEFDKVFRELFGGGKGTLELMEDEDILEAGVRIIAQPPGKKLQNMMQLSGGEKALTAIALLFAIQNLKPSPFCLLDEIEAALDESNVTRFANYLHKLTRHTQFIVITHRRGTMEKADRLYGITMQEKGVSVLVSVNLIDDKDLK